MAIINKTGIANGNTIQSEHVTRIIDALSGISTDSIVATGSFIGQLTGTSSFATSASYAQTASYAPNFANSDLVFDGNRNHELNGNYLYISNNYDVPLGRYDDLYFNIGGGIQLGSYSNLSNQRITLLVTYDQLVIQAGTGFSPLVITSGSTSYWNTTHSFTGSLNISGSTIMTGSLSVSGNTRITGSLAVNGNTSVTGSLTATNNLTINNTSSLKGTTIIGNGSDGTLIIPVNGTVNTTNETPTTLLTLPTTSGLIYTVTGKIIGLGPSNTTIGGDVLAVFNRTGGSLTQVGSSVKNVIEDFAGAPTFDLVVSGNNIILQVTGIAATTIPWAGQLQYITYNASA